MEDVKMFLFARWLATNYADAHVDHMMRSQHEEGFDVTQAISVLNRESGYWYKKQLKYFNETVYDNYIKNGSVKDAKQFLID